jgi:hypothetical protein
VKRATKNTRPWLGWCQHASRKIIVEYSACSASKGKTLRNTRNRRNQRSSARVQQRTNESWRSKRENERKKPIANVSKKKSETDATDVRTHAIRVRKHADRQQSRASSHLSRLTHTQRHDRLRPNGESLHLQRVELERLIVVRGSGLLPVTTVLVD